MLRSHNQVSIEGSFLGNHMHYQDKKTFWVAKEFENSTGPGNVLASLVFGLFEHLNRCVLMGPNLQEYLLRLVNDKACNLRIVDALFAELLGPNAPVEPQNPC